MKVVLITALAALALTQAYEASAKGGPGSLAGVWVNSDYKTSARFDPHEGIMRDIAGKLPPLQSWAAKLLEQRVKATEDGRPFATTKSQCLPAGMPQVMFGPALPLEILESPGKVTILIEEMTNFRQVLLDQPHAQDPDPTYFGDSVGRWEGDTLVVDTIGLVERTTLDPIGMPHSGDMHLVERFRRTGKDTLELEVRFEDPKAFTRAWTAKTHFKAVAGRKLKEDICENNRNLPEADGTMGVQGPGLEAGGSR